jgi:hypothetical protein
MSSSDIRRADFLDADAFANLIEHEGGASLFKATFGQYNYSTMIETSVAVLTAEPDNIGSVEASPISSGFICLNDSISCSVDAVPFEVAVEIISQYIFVTVSIHTKKILSMINENDF